MQKNDSLKLIASKEFETNANMYKIVDFLNKNLKDYGLIFGLTRKDESDTITIYNVDVEKVNKEDI